MDDNFFSKNVKKLFSKDSNFVKDTFQSIFDDRGHANILVAGSADVDTDGIIDSVFQGEFATRGQGKMLTGYARELTREEFPLSILVVRNSSVPDSLDEIENAITQRNSDPEESRHVHVAWMIFAEDSQEQRDVDSKIAEMISRLNIPIISVVVRNKRSLAFKPKAEGFPPEIGYICGLRASLKKDQETRSYNHADLEELSRASAEQTPKDQRTAFIVTQKANCKLKHDRALQVVSENALISAGAGAVPVPGAADVLLVASLARMLAKISSVYIVFFSSAFLSTMVTSIFGGAVLALTGRLVVGGLFKLIPGIGTVVGSVISASTATTLSTGLGAAYISILDALCKKNLGESPSEEEVLREIEKKFKRDKGEDPEADQDENDEEENPDHRS